MYKIDKGIPVPAGRTTPRTGKYPFASMSVGDSFFVVDEDQKRVAASAHGWGRRHGAKFRLSQVTEGNDKGVRVWRTE